MLPSRHNNNNLLHRNHVKRLSPAKIKFSQDSVAMCFQKVNEGELNKACEEIALGELKPSSISKIKVIKKNGTYISNDNRRLYVFRVLEIIGYLHTIEVEIKNTGTIDNGKYTTKNNGCHVRLRNGYNSSDEGPVTYLHCNCEDERKRRSKPNWWDEKYKCHSSLASRQKKQDLAQNSTHTETHTPNRLYRYQEPEENRCFDARDLNHSSESSTTTERAKSKSASRAAGTSGETRTPYSKCCPNTSAPPKQEAATSVPHLSTNRTQPTTESRSHLSHVTTSKPQHRPNSSTATTFSQSELSPQHHKQPEFSLFRLFKRLARSKRFCAFVGVGTIAVMLWYKKSNAALKPTLPVSNQAAAVFHEFLCHLG